MLLEVFDALRPLTPLSGMVRLLCAALAGGLIGLDRERKGRAAGFRTYMLVCMGAALTMLLGQYEHQMVAGAWKEAGGNMGVSPDVSRFGAQVINGIGFLGAGTIIVTGHQKVTGVTTAAGLWASACMGIAIGAGFYECMLLGVPLILLCFRLLLFFEGRITDYTLDMSVYLEFDRMELLDNIFTGIKALRARVYDVEIDHGRESAAQLPSVVLSFRMVEKQHHAQILWELSKIKGIRLVEEV